MADVLPTVTSTAQPAPASDPSRVTEGGTNVGAIVGGTLQNVDSERDWI